MFPAGMQMESYINFAFNGNDGFQQCQQKLIEYSSVHLQIITFIIVLSIGTMSGGYWQGNDYYLFP